MSAQENGRILLLNHQGLGEFLMSLPACRWLISEKGDCVWMTISGPEKDICRNQRCGSRFIPFAISKKNVLKVVGLIWNLRRLNIDNVVAFYGYDPKMVEIFSKIIGAKKWFCSPRCEKDYFDRNALHKRYRNLNIIAQCLGKSIPVGQENDYRLDSIEGGTEFRLSDISSYIVLVPGSGEKECFKRWPVEEFISFSKLFLASYPGVDVVIIGAKRERILANRIEEGVANSRISNLCGNLNLTQVVEVFRKSVVVLGADCGGLHLAKAAGARVAVVMGPTNYAMTGPIEAECVIDKKMPGTPWYCRTSLKERAYCDPDPSVQIPASDVLKAITRTGLLDACRVNRPRF